MALLACLIRPQKDSSQVVDTQRYHDHYEPSGIEKPAMLVTRD
jgi:hypothetical protein